MRYLTQIVGLHLQRVRRLWHITPMIGNNVDDAKRTVRVPLLLTPAEVKNLDDWQFANRLRTRSGAIRRLIDLGLEAAKAKAS
jgi:hypothetical protein